MLNKHTKDAWRRFAKGIELRLEDGEDTYEDRSFSKDPDVLVCEIREEVEDIVGWAFILDRRLTHIQKAAESLRAHIARAKSSS